MSTPLTLTEPANCNLTVVTFVYTPTPEPATADMLNEARRQLDAYDTDVKALALKYMEVLDEMMPFWDAHPPAEDTAELTCPVTGPRPVHNGSYRSQAYAWAPSGSWMHQRNMLHNLVHLTGDLPAVRAHMVGCRAMPHTLGESLLLLPVLAANGLGPQRHIDDADVFEAVYMAYSQSLHATTLVLEDATEANQRAFAKSMLVLRGALVTLHRDFVYRYNRAGLLRRCCDHQHDDVAETMGAAADILNVVPGHGLHEAQIVSEPQGRLCSVRELGLLAVAAVAHARLAAAAAERAAATTAVAVREREAAALEATRARGRAQNAERRQEKAESKGEVLPGSSASARLKDLRAQTKQAIAVWTWAERAAETARRDHTAALNGVVCASAVLARALAIADRCSDLSPAVAITQTAEQRAGLLDHLFIKCPVCPVDTGRACVHMEHAAAMF